MKGLYRTPRNETAWKRRKRAASKKSPSHARRIAKRAAARLELIKFVTEKD